MADTGAKSKQKQNAYDIFYRASGKLSQSRVYQKENSY